ncbi:zinc ribbon domain-containing protein [Candidatus Latescibacterota bacterium]
MPLYEYACTACGHKSEHLVFSDSDAPTCPKCSSKKLERLFSPFAVSVNQSRDFSPPCQNCSGGSCGLQ